MRPNKRNLGNLILSGTQERRKQNMTLQMALNTHQIDEASHFEVKVVDEDQQGRIRHRALSAVLGGKNFNKSSHDENSSLNIKQRFTN